MSVSTIEAHIENGQIKLPPNVHLPDSGQVFIVIPDARDRTFHIRSPRLVHPEQAEFLRKTMVEEKS